MAQTRKQAIRARAISELEKLSLALDMDLEITANMTIGEIDDELRGMGIDPDPRQLSPIDFGETLPEKSASSAPAYAYVSDELLAQERATDEVKLLIRQVRHLGQRQRFEEALKLAEQATVLAPDYWRAWISYGGLLVVLGHVDEGEAVYVRTREQFPDDSKAVAAAVHGCACVKEIRHEFNGSREDFLEVTRLYEEALKFDDSRANTRACLIINSALSGQISKSEQLLGDSLECDGFFDAMWFELRERGAREYAAKMYKVMQAFPLWFRDFLYGNGHGFGITDTSAVC
jgi:tetratricopeptide (TPR) repeat protein